jgi:hypothetical protein
LEAKDRKAKLQESAKQLYEQINLFQRCATLLKALKLFSGEVQKLLLKKIFAITAVIYEKPKPSEEESKPQK